MVGPIQNVIRHILPGASNTQQPAPANAMQNATQSAAKAWGLRRPVHAGDPDANPLAASGAPATAGSLKKFSADQLPPELRLDIASYLRSDGRHDFSPFVAAKALNVPPEEVAFAHNLDSDREISIARTIALSDKPRDKTAELLARHFPERPLPPSIGNVESLLENQHAQDRPGLLAELQGLESTSPQEQHDRLQRIMNLIGDAGAIRGDEYKLQHAILLGGLSIRAAMLSDKSQESLFSRIFEHKKSPQAAAVRIMQEIIVHGHPLSADSFAVLTALLGNVINKDDDRIKSTKGQKRVLKTVSKVLFSLDEELPEAKKIAILLGTSIPAFKSDQINSGDNLQTHAYQMTRALIRGEAFLRDRGTFRNGSRRLGFDVVPQINFSRRDTAEIIQAIAASLPHQPDTTRPGHARNPIVPGLNDPANTRRFVTSQILIFAGIGIGIGHVGARVAAQVTRRRSIKDALTDEMVKKLNQLPDQDALAAAQDHAPGWEGLLGAAAQFTTRADRRNQSKIVDAFLNQMEAVGVPANPAQEFSACYAALNAALPDIHDRDLQARARAQLAQFNQIAPAEQPS